tara:strand:- start:664 stop:819 length:156 start_codon:yes stop_codon:yes gene_type:complete
MILAVGMDVQIVHVVRVVVRVVVVLGKSEMLSDVLVKVNHQDDYSRRSSDS